MHPSFTAVPRSLAIFLTKIFELATLKQNENFLKIANRSGGSDGDPFEGALLGKVRWDLDCFFSENVWDFNCLFILYSMGPTLCLSLFISLGIR